MYFRSGDTSYKRHSIRSLRSIKFRESLLEMTLPMSATTVLPIECASAFRARVWPDASVYDHVTTQISTYTEHLPAPVAGVRILFTILYRRHNAKARHRIPHLEQQRKGCVLEAPRE